MARKKINQLTATSSVADTDLTITGNPTTGLSKKITWLNVWSYLKAKISFAAFGSTPNANGGSYSDGVITLQPASASHPGGVTTGSQTLAGTKTFTSNPIVSNVAPAYTEYRNTGQTTPNDAYSYVGAAGQPELIVSFNMKPTPTGVGYAVDHKYADSDYGATWLGIGEAFAIQYAPAGEPAGGDMWTSSGRHYMFYASPGGHSAFNTDYTDPLGDATVLIKRNTGDPSLSGDTDLIIDGARDKATAGIVSLNEYNSGAVNIAKGGGKVTVGNGGLGTIVVTPTNLQVAKDFSSGGNNVNAVFVASQSAAASAVYPLYSQARSTQSTGTITQLNGFGGSVGIGHTGGQVTTAVGVFSPAFYTGSGNTLSYQAFRSNGIEVIGGTGTVSNAYGYYMDPWPTTGITITAKWGVYINDATASNYLPGPTQVGALTGTTATLTGGNGNQVILNNTGQTYTQITFQNNSVTKSADYWDNSAARKITAVGGNEVISLSSTSATVNYPLTATQFKLSALNTAPASASASGTLGEIRVDANYIYICTATNTWKRVAIATW